MAKPKEQEESGKEMLDRIKKEHKQSKKEEKDMTKNTLKTVSKYALTVIVTLGVVYAAYSLYTWGHNDGVKSQKEIAQQVQAEVASSKPEAK